VADFGIALAVSAAAGGRMTETGLSLALADRYRIERELGQGGMATVYLAADLKHDRKVALKVLKPELAAVLGAERFVVEIKTTAALQHPHILPLFDSGTAEGFLYYVMPFIQGETLRTKLDRERQLGIDEAVRITTEIADALDYAHRQGVIHRDIKPENILLHDGRPMVADFGIALAVSAAAGGRMTETGLSLGTPHYMSPEQATGEREISGRSDVYSLGSMLYEMLTGNPPHTGASAQQIIMKIVTEEPAPVTKLRKSVPPNIAAAVAKSLEKLPADRFESAKAFAEALKNTSYTTVLLSSAAATGRTTRWKPALAAGLLVGALAGALAARAWAPASPAAGDRIREQITFNGRSTRPAIAPDGDFIAFVETACEHARYGRCRSSLLVQEVGSTQSRILLGDALALGTPRWSHDGRVLVVNGRLDDDRVGLFAVSRLTGAVQLLGPGGAYDTHPAADSVLLLPTRAPGKGVGLVISLANGAIADSVRLPFHWTRDVSWSPDAGHIAASTVGGITVVDRTGAVSASLPMSNRSDLRWSDDGRALLTFRAGAVKEDELMRIPMTRDGATAGDAELFMSRVPTLYQGQFDLARRTGQLVLATGDAITDIRSFDLTAHPFLGRTEARGTTWYGDPVLSLDGSSIFYYRGDALGDNVYMLDRATSREEALTAQRTAGWRLEPSADGRRLVYTRHSPVGTRVESMELPSRRVVVDTTSPRLAGIVAVVPGAILGQREEDGALLLKATPDGAWTPIPIPDSIGVLSFAASPDGAQLALAGVSTSSSDDSSPRFASARERRPMLGFVPLSGGGVRVVGTLEPDEPAPTFSWDRDGSLYLARALPTDVAPSLWRMSPENGALNRLGDLPEACALSSIMVGALGRTAVCLGEDLRSDIWLIDSKRGTK
ncbi:MAG TPA: protein kinase, partial [Gemmatimonadales bacterium]|nr:protein kinase [Gemmatimonadales bacterium]